MQLQVPPTVRLPPPSPTPTSSQGHAPVANTVALPTGSRPRYRSHLVTGSINLTPGPRLPHPLGTQRLLARRAPAAARSVSAGQEV